MSKKQRKPSVAKPLAGELAPPPERQYYSVGFVCQMIQQPPDFVHNLMQTCNVEFAWMQDGIGLVRGDDVCKMANYLADAREHVEAEKAAAPNN